MTQLGFYFDSDRCTSCKSCIAACKDKNNTFVGIKYRNVVDYCTGTWKQEGSYYVPDNVAVYATSYSCMHCAAPVCIAACPVSAITKRESDGVVFIDETICIGCGACVAACPYSAPRMNEEKGVAGKCDFCRSRIDNGENPACVDACLMRCLDWGDLEELKAEHGDASHVPPLPDPTTGPSYVLNPNRFAVDGIEGRVTNSEEELI
jgi:anaerobic dimethyl sulfoxide reductase subunit B (iron-sulfur subunit)